jgi:D-glycero-alpha-D-manno-heptose-7-phosphate kinase
MIITRTPYRVSLFGGGSDFPEWYATRMGKVISFTINKYCYISARELPPFFEHNYRVSYSKVETAKKLDDIKHPAFREIIRKYGNQQRYEIHHHGDLPAKSGVGSSSAFAVGLINAMSQFQENEITQIEIAKAAIELEQDILNEKVGSQDQIACSLGGINEISFGPGNNWKNHKLDLKNSTLKKIEDHSVLIFSGIQRISSKISESLVTNLSKSEKYIERNIELVDECVKILTSSDDIQEIGKLLKENWTLKKLTNPMASNSFIDDFFEKAIKSGAIGGKILGAGGGGFSLFWVKPENRARFLKDFGLGVEVPFKIDDQGTTCVLNSDLSFRSEGKV